MIEKKYAYLAALNVLLELKDLITDMRCWVVAPADIAKELMNLIAAMGFFFGFPKTSIYPHRKSELKWESLTLLLGPDLFSKMQEMDIEAVRKDLPQEQKLPSIKALIEIDEEKAKAFTEVFPAFNVMLTFMKSVIDYRLAYVEFKRSEYNARKAKAEEAGEPFSEPALNVELGDDFDE